MKLKINLVNQLDTDYVVVKKKAISAVANTIKQLHIQTDIHMIYKKYLYNNKEKKIYNLFLECLVPVMGDLDHPAFIEEWEKNLDTTDYEKYIQRCKVTIN